MSNLSVFDFAFIEAVKLALQFSGALVIARLTVKWALGRYKSEKTWERRLSAYVDAIASVAEMERLVSMWLDRAYRRGEVADDERAREGAEYRSARRKLDEGTSAARLLLPGVTSDIFSTLELDLDKASNAEFLEDHLESQLTALLKAKEALISNGQNTLQLPKVG